MATHNDAHVNWVRVLAGILALGSAAVCVIVPLLFAQSQPSLWPLPALYFIEIAVVGFVGLFVATRQLITGYAMLWIVAGVLLAFVILGMWTFGLFLVPAFVGFFVTAVLLNKTSKRSLASGFSTFLLAFIAQISLMLMVILLSY